MKNNICGYHFFIGNRKGIIESIFSQINSKKTNNTTITFLDSKFFGNYYANPRCIQFYNNYDYLINSSRIIRIMSILKRKKVKYISHIKMMNGILKKMQSENYTVYIYAKKENTNQIRDYFRKKYPGISIIGISDDSESDEKVISRIRKVKPDVVLIGNTSNIQSEFILDNVECFNSKLIISCGQFFAKISDVKIKKDNLKFLKKYLKTNIDKKKKKNYKKRGYVVGWFYPPQTTAQAISTYKILKNSKINYDVFTTKSRIWNYNSETNLNIFDTPNINVFTSEETDPNLWCNLACKEFLENSNKYDFFMTRVMPSWSHNVGLKIRDAGDNTKWVASFADPMFNSPYVLYNIANSNFNQKTADSILNNYNDIFKNPQKKKYECFKTLIDEKNNILKVFEQSDLMIFTNKYQLEWMLGDLYDKYSIKCLVLPHSYDPEFYLYHEKKNNDVKSFLFIGHTDKLRNLNSFVEAISEIIKDNPSFSKKIKVTLIGSIYEETLDLIKRNKLEKIFVIENNVDYISSLDLMSKSDVLIHSDAKFKFMNDLNIYFASKISDYIGSGRLVLSLSTKIGPTVDVLKETNHIVCEIDDVDKIKKEIINIVDGKYNNLKHNNYLYSSPNVVKEYDKEIYRILKRKK